VCGEERLRVDKMQVKDVMNRQVVTVRPEATLRQAAALLVKYGFNALPVETDSGELVGILGIRDLLTAPQNAGAAPRMFATASMSDKFDIWEQTQVRQVMSDQVITITEDTPVMQAVALMSNMGVHPLPVLRDRRLVGIVSRKDTLKGILFHDQLEPEAIG
jgi:CBS domain-containing protein